MKKGIKVFGKPKKFSNDFCREISEDTNGWLFPDMNWINKKYDNNFVELHLTNGANFNQYEYWGLLIGKVDDNYFITTDMLNTPEDPYNLPHESSFDYPHIIDSNNVDGINCIQSFIENYEHYNDYLFSTGSSITSITQSGCTWWDWVSPNKIFTVAGRVLCFAIVLPDNSGFMLGAGSDVSSRNKRPFKYFYATSPPGITVSWSVRTNFLFTGTNNGSIQDKSTFEANNNITLKEFFDCNGK